MREVQRLMLCGSPEESWPGPGTGLVPGSGEELTCSQNFPEVEPAPCYLPCFQGTWVL